ncbi:hypothetical protein, partial [Burkholderia multivorans]|uniref:hypothetical protein n=1 Tax=Burkholderia multivorans TaxID=87883 RepID=UPI001C65532F
FRAELGIGPKEAARVIRFDRARRMIAGSAGSTGRDESAGRADGAGNGASHTLAEVAAPDVWHRVHPLTPLLESLGIIVVIIVTGGYVGQNFIQQAISDLASGDAIDLSFAAWLGSHQLVLLAVIGGIVLIVLIGALYSWLAWRVMGYRVDDEA